MSLIPFILDLADELHEFSRCLTSGTDINDFGFGLYTGANDQQQQQPASPQQQQQQSSNQQQTPRRRTSSFSSTFWLPTKRHHPYNRIKSACCGKTLGDEGGAVSIGVGITGAGAAAAGEKDVPTTPGTPGKAASYSVVNKNGFQVSMNVKQFAPNELSVKTIDNCIVVEGRHDDKEDGHGVISRHFVRKYMLPKGYDPKDVLSTLSSDGILTVKAPPPPPPIAKNDERIERVVEIQPAPGPAHVVVSAAKDTPVKEQTKKLLSPAARAECQLPEKRQKLDLTQQEHEIKDAAQQTLSSSPAAPAQPQTPTPSFSSLTESTAVKAAAVAAATETADIAVVEEEMTKKPEEEQTAEIDNKEEKANDDGGAVVADTPANNEEIEMEGTEEDAKPDAATAEPTTDGKELKETEEMETDETDKTLVVEKLPETNGDVAATETSESSIAAVEPVAESCLKSKDDKVPAISADKDEGKTDNATEMEVDEVKDDTAKAVKNTKPAEAEKNAKTIIENDATDNNSNNKEETNAATQNDKNNADNAGNDVPADCANAAATPKAAESVANADVPIKSAVLSPEANNKIDDVALLKAAVTADAAADIKKAEEKELLSEPMEGIATSGSPTVVETVECSLFAKSHLGNGNSAALVATEEMAN